MSLLKPCLACGTPSEEVGRCGPCQLELARTRGPRDRTYDKRSHLANPARWKRLSKRLRKAQAFCLRCGSTERLQVDHVDPDGPEYDVGNLQVLCARCHARKGGEGTPAPVGVPAAGVAGLRETNAGVARG